MEKKQSLEKNFIRLHHHYGNELNSPLSANLWSLKAWNSDGLRSLTKTMKIPNIIEKTLRYPGTPKKYVYNLYDRYNRETPTTIMARTTGYTCTAVVILILERGYARTGLVPPEFIGEQTVNFQFMLDYLEQRGVVYKIKME